MLPTQPIEPIPLLSQRLRNRPAAHGVVHVHGVASIRRPLPLPCAAGRLHLCLPCVPCTCACACARLHPCLPCVPRSPPAHSSSKSELHSGSAAAPSPARLLPITPCSILDDPLSNRDHSEITPCAILDDPRSAQPSPPTPTPAPRPTLVAPAAAEMAAVPSIPPCMLSTPPARPRRLLPILPAAAALIVLLGAVWAAGGLRYPPSSVQMTGETLAGLESVDRIQPTGAPLMDPPVEPLEASATARPVEAARSLSKLLEASTTARPVEAARSLSKPLEASTEPLEASTTAAADAISPLFPPASPVPAMPHPRGKTLPVETMVTTTTAAESVDDELLSSAAPHPAALSTESDWATAESPAIHAGIQGRTRNDLDGTVHTSMQLEERPERPLIAALPNSTKGGFARLAHRVAQQWSLATATMRSHGRYDPITGTFWGPSRSWQLLPSVRLAAV